MTVEVPLFAEGLKDEGILTLIAFCTRIAERYGYEETYSIHLDDVSRICNKRRLGLEDYLWDNPTFSEYIAIGKPFDDVIVFKWKQKPERMQNRPRTKLVKVDLVEHRQQLVWAYLLGNLNSNMLEEEGRADWLLNSYGQKSFSYYGQKAKGYIKKSDR